MKKEECSNCKYWTGIQALDPMGNQLGICSVIPDSLGIIRSTYWCPGYELREDTSEKTDN